MAQQRGDKMAKKIGDKILVWILFVIGFLASGYFLIITIMQTWDKLRDPLHPERWQGAMMLLTIVGLVTLVLLLGSYVLAKGVRSITQDKPLSRRSAPAANWAPKNVDEGELAGRRVKKSRGMRSDKNGWPSSMEDLGQTGSS